VQRVAIARALAPRPQILLLDEPFNNLDIALREQIIPDLHAVLRRYRIAALCITHLPQEAFALADRIAVLDSCRIAQIDDPRQLYRKPINSNIAQFFGLINSISAYYSHQHQLVYVSPEHLFIPPANDRSLWDRDMKLEILLRPDELELFFNVSIQECKREDMLSLRGVIVETKYFGYFQMLKIAIKDGELSFLCSAHIATDIDIALQQQVVVGLPIHAMHIVAHSEVE